MTIKLSWYKATKTIVEAASVIYFIIGTFVFLVGLLKLFWAQSASTSVNAGSYMVGAFVAIGTALMGFLGAYTENFCMVMAYACIQLVSFAVRTIITMVMVKISFTKALKDEKDALDEQIPYMISGLPGTSSVAIELLYSVIEISLALCGVYLAWALNRRDNLQHLDPRLYYTANEQPVIYYSNANVM